MRKSICKRFLALFMVLAMALGVTACGGKKETSVGVIGDTIKIGVVCPISGNSALAGKYITHGVEVVEDELGGKIEIGGKEYNIEFIYMDNEASEEKTTNVFQKLIEEEKVIAIVGPDMSKCALAGGPIAQKAGCPVVTTFATNTAVTEVGDYIFRACFIDPFQGKMAAQYVWDSGYKTACIMLNNADAYPTGLTDAFIESYEALGGTVVAQEEYSGSDVKDYNVQLTKLAASGAECCFFPNLLGELGLQIQQARTAGINCPIVCGDSADTPEVGEVAGAAIEGVAYVSAFSAESTSDAAKTFVEKYTEKFKDETPNSNAELAYEATQMVIYALQNAEELSREGVRDALAGIEGLELPSGSMTMAEDRNPIKGGVVMQYDADGVSHYVSTINPD
ncbi:ABC transporter substrate-binding protein [Lacrimispora sp. NSJ-141]|uniref:ABC transporter substrate-binding protein n=1 Tax=Lientehia hominis TaxID=2897778 RepID=A0AAP2RKF8_9FIRM|nr:ABC transporter substrate-binding protein [Lientehia hominis]MCD2493672.1 ABC transporter substrate-binding protein [Lientehia hominis]